MILYLNLYLNLGFICLVCWPQLLNFLTLLTLPLSMVCALLALGRLATRVLCLGERLCAGICFAECFESRCYLIEGVLGWT